MANEVVIPENDDRVVMVQKGSSLALPDLLEMEGSRLSDDDLFNILDEEVKLRDWLSANDMTVKNVVAAHGRFADKMGTGEGFQLVLITKEKKAIRVSAQITISRLATLLNMKMKKGWTKPLNLKFRLMDAGIGQSYGVKIM